MPRKSSSPSLKLHLFGHFELETDGGLVRLPTRKIESLLSYLVLQPQAHAREKIASLFWGDSTDALARASLRSALKLIRRHLGADLLLADRQSVQISSVFPLWVDVREFSDSYRSTKLLKHSGFSTERTRTIEGQAKFDQLKAKVALYRDDLLDEFYDDWILPERERLRTDYLDSLLRLSQAQLIDGDTAGAIEHAHKILNLESTNESAHRLLMVCFLATGNRQAALKQFEECKRILQQELELEPAPETAALYRASFQNKEAIQSATLLPGQFITFGELLKFLRHRVGLSQRALSVEAGCSATQISRLEHDQSVQNASSLLARLIPALRLEQEPRWTERLIELSVLAKGIRSDPPTAEHRISQNLPMPLTLFVGRKSELGEIGRRLNDPDCRLLTLVGAGGIGKTRLALEAASRQSGKFRDGVNYVPLASMNTGQVEFIAIAIANVIGLQLEGSRRPPLQLLDYLQPRSMLLLLDNFEHLLDGRELILDILRDAPQIKILVTSRMSLGVQPEWLFQVRGLSYPEKVVERPEELLAFASARLFVDRARRVNEHFSLDKETIIAITHICQSVEGMPLALELAAARVRTLPVRQIATQVAESFETLRTTMHDVEARHRSLRAVLDWSYQLLSEPERALFGRLAVFAGGWTPEAAQAIGIGEPIAAAQIPPLLNALYDKSLVLLEQEKNTLRYRMLEPVRQYAETRLRESGEHDEVRRRHLDFYLEMGELEAESLSEQIEDFRADLGNLRAATSWSQRVEIPEEIRLRMACALGAYLSLRGDLSEAKAWLTRALEGLEERTPSPELASAVWRLANSLSYLGEYALADSQYLRCMKFYQALGQPAEYARALMRRGWIAREQGNGAVAQTHLESSLAISRENEDQLGTATTLITLGEVFVMLKQGAKAKNVIQEALALGPALGQNGIHLMGWGLDHLGHVAQLEGRFENARRLHAESLPIFRESGMELGSAWAYQGLGECALGEGDASAATTHLRAAILIFNQMGDQVGVSWCLAGLAGAAALNGELERAALLWGASEQLRHSLGAREAPASGATHKRLSARARRELGEAGFETLWAEGVALTKEERIALAMQSPAPEPWAS